MLVRTLQAKGDVSSSEKYVIPSTLTTKKNDKVLYASFEMSLRNHHELSSRITRSTESFSGYSIVDGAEELSPGPYSP